MANQPRSPFYVPRPPLETYWEFRPRDRLIQPLLTNVKIYGLGGQGPTKQWHYDYSEIGFWEGKPRGSMTLRPLLANQTKNKQQRYDYSEQGFWEGRPRGSLLIRPLLTAAGQVHNKQPQTFVEYFEDPTYWPGYPRGSQIIHPLLTAAGQPPTKRWIGYYTTFDEPPFTTVYRGVSAAMELQYQVIATVNYSLHPINCMMSGTEPPDYKRITDWMTPPAGTKETHTATKRGGRLSKNAPSFTTKSGRGGPLD